MFCVCVLPRDLLSRLIEVGSVYIGSFWRGSILKNNLLGLIPSVLDMLLQATIASSRLAFSACVRVKIALRFVTAASARPLDYGL